MAYWYSGWDCADEGTVKYAKLPCSLFFLQFSRHNDISRLIHEQRALHAIVADSTLSLLRDIYQRHGALDPQPPQLQPLQADDDDMDDEEEDKPVTVVPRIHYCRHYHLVAINGAHLQRFIRKYVDATFRLSALLWRFCEEYGVDIVKTFPSMRHEESNNVPTIGVATVARRRPRSVKPAPLPAPDGSGVYDNDELYGPNANLAALLAPAPDTTAQEKALERQRRQARRRELERRRQEEDARLYTRLIPVTLLPLLMQMMPDYYQTATNTVSECLALKEKVLQCINLSAYPSYIHEQVEALHLNAMYVACVNQKRGVALSTLPMSDNVLELERLRHDHAMAVEGLEAQLDEMHVLYAKALKKLGIDDGDEDESHAEDERGA